MSRLAKFSVACMATYQAELNIPDEVEEGEEIDYIQEHLDEVPVTKLEWVSDLEDAVTEEDIISIDKESEPEQER